jgi:hypothetical protein
MPQQQPALPTKTAALPLRLLALALALWRFNTAAVAARA